MPKQFAMVSQQQLQDALPGILADQATRYQLLRMTDRQLRQLLAAGVPVFDGVLGTEESWEADGERIAATLDNVHLPQAFWLAR